MVIETPDVVAVVGVPLVLTQDSSEEAFNSKFWFIFPKVAGKFITLSLVVKLSTVLGSTLFKKENAELLIEIDDCVSEKLTEGMDVKKSEEVLTEFIVMMDIEETESLNLGLDNFIKDIVACLL